MNANSKTMCWAFRGNSFFWLRRLPLATVLTCLIALGASPGLVQNFQITPSLVSNKVLNITFPGRADSYYFLYGTPSLTAPPTPLTALLGFGSTQLFQVVSNQAGSMFFRVRQFSQSDTNDMDSDGIPDYWEMIHGLNPLQTADALQTIPGGTNFWLRAYTNLSPEVSFVQSESYVFYPQNTVNIPIVFSKPASGKFRIELSGSAVAGVDYAYFATPVSGFTNIIREISITNASSLVLPISLLWPTNDFRGERQLVLTLRSVATVAGNQVNRSAGPAPGAIHAHTIIMNEGERVWSGVLDFSDSSGFGSFSSAFTLSSLGVLQARFSDSKFLASVIPGAGAVSSQGSLVFSVPLTGSYSFDTNGPAAAWSLQFGAPQPFSTNGLPAVAVYPAQLSIQGFPVPGLTRSYSGTLTLSQ